MSLAATCIKQRVQIALRVACCNVIRFFLLRERYRTVRRSNAKKKGRQLANSITTLIAANALRIASTGEAPRQKVAYVNGVKTDSPVLRDGKPVQAFNAVGELGGQPLGIIRVETTGAIPETGGLGSVLAGHGAAEMKVRAVDTFNLAVTVFVENLVAEGNQRKGGE